MPLQLEGLGPEGQNSLHFEELLSSLQPRGPRGLLEFVRRRSENTGQPAPPTSLLDFRHNSPSRLRSPGRSGLAVPGLFGSPLVAGQSHTVLTPIGRRWPRPARQVVCPALWLLGRDRAAPRGLAQVAAPRSPHWPQVPPAPGIGSLDVQVPPPAQCAPAPRTAQVPRSWRGGCPRSRAARSLPRSTVCPAWRPGPSPGPLAMAGASWKQC